MTGRQPILVVGASGRFAGHVVPALAHRGARVRGMIRTAAGDAEAREHGAAEIVVADLTDAASLPPAFEGIEKVFYIAPAFMPQEAAVGTRFVAAAIAAGIKRIVFSSVIHPVIGGLPNHAAKAPVEEAILDSGIEYTFLHPALYFQNFERDWTKVREAGVLAEPWSAETPFSRVDYRDVAEVAAIALTEDRLLYGTFELAAEGWLNRHDVARLMGEALGRPVRADRIDPDTLGAAAAPMRPMFAHYDRVGLRANSLTLRAILGREPRALADFFHELADKETTP
jgi:uncharacterized protein YbjT (DUF2867 family)